MIRFQKLPLLLLMLMIGAGCTREDPLPEPPPDTATTVVDDYDLSFPEPEFADGRSLDTIISTDFNGNGRLEYVVASLGDDEFRPAEARADVLEFYWFDTVSRRYKVNLRDTLEWSSEILLEDVTGEGRPELVVPTFAGGNDVVASQGLYVYSGADGRLRRIFRSTRGAPEFTTLGNQPGKAIVVHDLLWPMFASHADAVAYPSKIYGYRRGRFRDISSERPDFFMRDVPAKTRRYQQVRDEIAALADAPPVDDTSDSPPATRPGFDDPEQIEREISLFQSAAQVILSLKRANEKKALLAFWDSERSFLKENLVDSYYEELETIYAGGTSQ